MAIGEKQTNRLVITLKSEQTILQPNSITRQITAYSLDQCLHPHTPGCEHEQRSRKYSAGNSKHWETKSCGADSKHRSSLYWCPLTLPPAGGVRRQASTLTFHSRNRHTHTPSSCEQPAVKEKGCLAQCYPPFHTAKILENQV